jgi:ParB family chromosome partitioning protein
MTKETLKQPLEQIYDIRLKDITISTDNVRHSDPIGDLGELAASIKLHGLLQPVVLRGAIGDQPPYELISGQRRYLAHKKILNAATIRAVFAGPLNKTESIVRSLVENLQRRDLEYEDTAEAVTYLYEKYGKDEYKVQKNTGLSIRRIRDLIQIEAKATAKIKRLLSEGKITATDVKRAFRAAQDNIKKAEEVVELIIKNKPTAYEKRRLATFGEAHKSASAKSILDAARKPQVEQNIIVSLPPDLLAALAKATKAMAMEPEDLAVKVLTEWLRTQGFVP